MRKIYVFIAILLLFGMWGQGLTPALAANPSIIISPTSGPWGSSVTVTGSGFANGETGIAVTYDGTPRTTGITASDQGTWSTTFTVPYSSPGNHSVDAYGDTTTAASVSNRTFIVPNVSISLSATGGVSGSSMTVTGLGFGYAETGITVTYDTKPVATATNITADSQGTWSTTFTIPASSAGNHIIDASGSTTTAATVTDMTFTVPSAAISLSTLSGAPGSLIIVTGSGFNASETGITVTYDGTTYLTTGITATSQGTWSTTFTVPTSASGTHSIGVKRSNTQAASVTDASFIVSASISISPNTGVSGTSVTVTGSGFSAAETGITVTYDANSMTTGIKASLQGTWSTTFSVPASASGTHIISAYGSTTQAASVGEATFIVGASISISQSTGASGTSVTVTGSGFGVAETGIVVTYDGTPVTTRTTASSQGTWNATFRVPTSAFGTHSIRAYGYTTKAANVPDVTFTVGASISISRSTGSSGTSVTVTGSGFGAAETGITVTYDGTPVTTGTTANSQGTWSTTFSVPASASGSHSIGAYGSTTQAASVGEVSFIVGASLSISRNTGASGSSVTVTGSGFGAAETGITVTYDGTPVTTGITASSQGTWNATVIVPTSASGAHSIRAYGSTTQAASVGEATFTVGANVSISRNTGASGSSVAVTGSGFGAAETGIMVTYDETPVATGITASSQGTWNATFIVPTSTSGSHIIRAYGSITQAASVGEISFIVGASISINRSTGSSGTSVTVTGSGFGATETGITVTYDGNPMIKGITASSQGTWNATFSVPASAYGSYSIRAYSSTTQAASVGEVSFNVIPAISISPASGYVGTKIKITGSGYSANSTITFINDDTKISGEQATTDASGSFVKSISAPKSKSGDHSLSAVDEQRNEAKTTFTIESFTPDAPSLLSPKDGARLSILGDIHPTLRWSAVTNDPNGVSYFIQIDTSPDFSNPILVKDNLTSTSYSLTNAESLSRGHYYWRVKTVDSASNESAWSQTWSLKSGLIALWTLVLIIILCIAAVIGIVYFIIMFIIMMLRRRRRKAIVVPEVEMPLVTGDWSEARSEEAPRQISAPWRRALPSPSKGVKKQLSPEEQARFKLIADFAQSLPLVEPGFTVDWMVSLVESTTGITASQQVYERLLQNKLGVHYEPGWTGHYLYQELKTVLGDHPVVQELGGFVETVNRCGTEGLLLLREIYRDCIAEVPSDFLGKGGWRYISAIYSDTTGWFRGKSLQDPSERDYAIKWSTPEGDTNVIWLYGEENTSFAGPLIEAQDDNEAQRLRALHLKLRRRYRSSERAKQLVGMITQLQLQRERLVSTFAQISRPLD